MLLLGHKEEHSVGKKLSDVWSMMQMVYTVVNATTNPSPHASSKSSTVNLPMWCRLTQVFLEERPLNKYFYCCRLSKGLVLFLYQLKR